MSDAKDLQAYNPPTGISAAAARPSYLDNYDAPKGTEEVQNLMLPSFIRIVQGMSDAKDEHGEGAIIIAPDNIRLRESGLWESDPGVPFVPIKVFREWAIWNPREVPNLPFIREATSDPHSEIARIAQDEKLRSSIPCPEDAQYKLRYMEHLNFIVCLYFDGAPTTPFVISFTGTQHKKGRRLINLAVGRNAHMYSCVFELRTRKEKNAKGKWVGWEIVNHAAKPFVDEQEFKAFLALHKSISQAMDKGEVKVDYNAGMSDGLADGGELPIDGSVSDEDLADDTGL